MKMIPEFAPDSSHILVDGTLRSRLNSKLQPISTSDEDVTAFWRWFGDSHSVDADGRPLVGYHGTASKDIKEFGSWRGVAGHFTYDPEFANGYADEAHRDAIADEFDPEDFGAVVYPVYLKALNVFDLRDNTHRAMAGIDVDEPGSYEILEASLDEIQSAGFDSYLDFEYDVSAGPTGIAVFEADQIKSAVGNPGTYDPEDPRITDHAEWNINNKRSSRLRP